MRASALMGPVVHERPNPTDLVTLPPTRAVLRLPAEPGLATAVLGHGLEAHHSPPLGGDLLRELPEGDLAPDEARSMELKWDERLAPRTQKLLEDGIKMRNHHGLEHEVGPQRRQGEDADG